MSRQIPLSRRLLSEGEGIEGDALLHCPVCGFEFTHHVGTTDYWRSSEDGPTQITRFQNGQAETYTGGLDNPSRRRGAIALQFECEAGCEFEIQFVQHKGQTFVRAFGTEAE